MVQILCVINDIAYLGMFNSDSSEVEAIGGKYFEGLSHYKSEIEVIGYLEHIGILF